MESLFLPGLSHHHELVITQIHLPIMSKPFRKHTIIMKHSKFIQATTSSFKPKHNQFIIQLQFIFLIDLKHIKIASQLRTPFTFHNPLLGRIDIPQYERVVGPKLVTYRL